MREFVVDSMTGLLNLNPGVEDENRYEVIKCHDVFQQVRRKDWVEGLMKLAYLSSKVLEIVCLVDKTREWKFKHSEKGGVPTICFAEKYFYHAGFKIIKEEQLDKGRMKFLATKMPRIEWSLLKPDLHMYPDDTVVRVPITHSFFDWYWYYMAHRDKEKEERRAKEKVYLKNFRIWYFTPIVYCIPCRRLHDGKHRLMMSKGLGFQAVNVRIQDTPKLENGECAKEKAWVDMKR